MSVHYHYGEFPPKSLDYSKITEKAVSASAALARYDGLLSLLDNSSLLLSPMVTREAVLSSKIEGTQATVEDVLEYDAGIKVSDAIKSQDIQEVVNYRLSMLFAEQLIGDKKIITGRVVRSMHAELMDGVRGAYKSPGIFRTEQNWVGERGSTVETAKYVPVSPDKLLNGIAEWEKYVNNSKSVPLIKAAIAHAEFESLHPFLDGNGRVGRMLIPLMLWNDGIMCEPNFYISSYFESHRDDYQDRLLAVSKFGDWTGWCTFFLGAVEDQANENRTKVQRVFKLHNNLINSIHKVINSKDAIPVVNALFASPVFTLNSISDAAEIDKASVRRIISAFLKSEIVKILKESSGRAPTIYYFPALMAITENV